MVFSKFKEKRIKKRIDKKLLKKSTHKIVASKNKINSILILIDENFDKNVGKLLVKELGVNISKISFLVFYDKLEKEDTSVEKISRKDFGLFGNVKTNEVKDIINQQFDLLLNLTTKNLFLNILTAFSNSKFKVGFSNSDKRLYDLMIDADNISIFSSELKKYLKILNKL